MSAQTTQTTAHSPEFQAIIAQVETALTQAAEDARELAERTGTPLVVRDVQGNQTCWHLGSGSNPQSGAQSNLNG